ncbi:hypothetical protein ACVXG7_29535 [Enterobacter hormaechei]
MALSAIDLKTQKIVWQVPAVPFQDTVCFWVKMRMQMPSVCRRWAVRRPRRAVWSSLREREYSCPLLIPLGEEVWKARLPVDRPGGPVGYAHRKPANKYILISAGGARRRRSW